MFILVYFDLCSLKNECFDLNQFLLMFLMRISYRQYIVYVAAKLFSTGERTDYLKFCMYPAGIVLEVLKRQEV